MELNPAGKILVIRLSSLGDILLSTPMLRSIKKKYPSLKIDYLVREEYKDALVLNPNINKLLCYRNDRSSPIKEYIRNENYDYVIDLQNNMRSAGLPDKIPLKIKFRKRNFSKFLLVNFKINLLKNSPPVPERYIEEIDNFALDGNGPELFTNREASDIFMDSEKYIGFAPGAKHFTKRWLPDYYIELGKKISSNGFKVVIFGGKDDKGVCDIVSQSIPGSYNLANDNDLLQISADMKKCLAVVCNDSGLMHTASASGVPVLAIFGSTVREFGFAPYKTKHRIAEHISLPCRPCTHIGRDSCPKGHFKCMKEITPSSVHENLIALLDNR